MALPDPLGILRDCHISGNSDPVVDCSPLPPQATAHWSIVLFGTFATLRPQTLRLLTNLFDTVTAAELERRREQHPTVSCLKRVCGERVPVECVCRLAYPEGLDGFMAWS